MRAFLLLLLAIGAFVGGRMVLYPTQTLHTASGTSYEVMDMSRRCLASDTCMNQTAYLTATTDSASQRQEAAALIAALGDSAKKLGDVAFVVGAVEPGPLRLLPPRRARLFLFARQGEDGEWYLWGVKKAKATYHGWKEIG